MSTLLARLISGVLLAITPRNSRLLPGSRALSRATITGSVKLSPTRNGPSVLVRSTVLPGPLLATQPVPASARFVAPRSTSVPAGSVTVTTALMASLGPRLRTVAVTGMVWPATAVAGASSTSARSASVVTPVGSLSVTTEVGASGVALVSTTVLVSVLPCSSDGASRTVTWTLLLPPTASVPKAQVTFWPATAQPPVLLTCVVPAGRASVMTTLWALLGPLFTTTIS